ncbi:hypothetical protein V7V80_04475 [Pseudomonas kermanshahensis]|uniref:Uncharacterized protein n=1 Tax=Pseudomonas kermanshahensis TaxID=2745482 RepID=A0ABU8R281_9PSED
MSIHFDYRRLRVGDTHPGTGVVITQRMVDESDIQGALHRLEDADIACVLRVVANAQAKTQREPQEK